MYRKIYWLNPIVIYLGLLSVVTIAYLTPDVTFASFYGAVKGIDFGYYSLHIATFLFFLSGYLASKKTYIKEFRGFIRRFDSDRITDAASLLRLYRLFMTVTFIAYAVWYAGFVANHGLNAFQYMLSLQGISDLASFSRNASGKIAGITSFTESGIVAACIGVYLLEQDISRKKIRRIKTEITILLLLALFRALVFSERLAIIEIALPMLIVKLALSKNKRIKFIVKMTPVFGIALLFVIFGIFEFTRSWMRHFSKIGDSSYFEFVTQRVLQYYIDAINTECLVLKYGYHIFGYRTFEWLWRIAELAGIVNLEAFKLSFSNILFNYGKVDMNNPGGILVFFTDWRMFFPIFEFIFGFIIGCSYKLFKEGNLFGLFSYSYCVLGLVELPRYFLFGSTRFFTVALAFAVMFLCFRPNTEMRRA